MSTLVTEILSTHLKELANNHTDVQYGICNYIRINTRQLDKETDGVSGDFLYKFFKNLMNAACEDWEHYSKCDIYPIIHPDFTGGEDGDMVYVMNNGDILYKSDTGYIPNTRRVFRSNGSAAYESACKSNNDGQGKLYAGEYGRRRLELVQRMIDIINE